MKITGEIMIGDLNMINLRIFAAFLAGVFITSSFNILSVFAVILFMVVLFKHNIFHKVNTKDGLRTNR